MTTLARQPAVSVDHSDLIAAVQTGKYDVCVRICETGWGLDMEDALYCAALYKNTAMMRLFCNKDRLALPGAIILAYQTGKMSQDAFHLLLTFLPGGQDAVERRRLA
jgi:hypothetical protein